MSDKERLKGIKNNIEILTLEERLWLIEQAEQNKRYRELLKKVFGTLRDYLHVYTNESDLIDSAEYLSKQIYEELEESE